jgi:PAS domain S-box-containing protein
VDPKTPKSSTVNKPSPPPIGAAPKGKSAGYAPPPRSGEWLVFVAVLLATAVLSTVVHKITEQNALQRFEYRAEQEKNRILFGLTAHTQVLRGGAALFSSSDTVSRDKWRNYVRELHLEKSQTATQGTGFILMVPASEKQRHEQEMHAQGLADYAIYPQGERERYTPVVYLEPSTGRNRTAFGYDGYQEPTRRTAIERARDTGEPALSGKITLVQETHHDPQPGFLIYVPVYRKIANPETIAGRQGAFFGLVYSPFRAHDLMRSIISRDNRDVEIELYDEAIAPDRLLFNSLANATTPVGKKAVDIPIEYGGHQWIARFRSRPELDAITSSQAPAGIAFGGTLFALSLLFWMRRNSRLQQRVAAYTAQLQENEERLRTLINAMPDIVCLKDGQNRLIEANAVFLHQFGLEEIDFRGKTLEAIAQTESLDRSGLAALEASDESVWQHGERLHDELTLRCPDNSERVFDVAKIPLYHSDGTRQAMVVVGRDTTERTATEKALRTTERKFRGLVEQSLVGVYIIQRGHFRYVNPRFAEIFGFDTPEDIIDKVPMIDLVAPSDREKVADNVRKRMTGEVDVLHYEFVGTRRDGQLVNIEVLGSSVEYEDRAAVIGVLLDITERIRTETELKHHREHLEDEVSSRTVELLLAKDAAEAANRAKTTFLANMSHELRTPMNAIIGFTHILTQNAQDAAQRKKLGKIGAAADHLLRLLNDILDISKIETDHLTLERTPLNVGELIGHVDTLIGEKIRAKGLTFLQEVSPQLSNAHLLGDPLRFKQILINLLDNALKFTERGSISLSASVTDETPDQLALSIAIRDTGCGIPGDALERIFSPFEQADGSTTRAHGGTGLGLTIVRQLSRMMQGDVTASSVPGVGSTFTLTARLDKDLAAADVATVQTARGASHVPGTPQRRVLLVEDDEINREVAQELLSDYPELVVDSAENGAVACKLTAANRYDLILMDMQMPVLDGLQATRLIRQQDANRRVPIVAMTANVFTDDKARCLAAGMSDFMSKPVSPEVLDAKLAQWLGVKPPAL